MQNQPCYWWVDPTLSVDEQKICGICLNCMSIQKPNNSHLESAWFWTGGYGNYDLPCLFCNTLINEKDKISN